MGGEGGSPMWGVGWGREPNMGGGRAGEESQERGWQCYLELGGIVWEGGVWYGRGIAVKGLECLVW